MRKRSLRDAATDQIAEGFEVAGDTMADAADIATDALGQRALAGAVTSSLAVRLLTNRKFLTALVVLVVGAVVYKKFFAADKTDDEQVLDTMPTVDTRTPA